MYFLIVCRLVFLFSLLRAVWQKKNRKGYRRHKIRKYKENGFWIVSCDFAILFFDKRHEVKKIKRLAGTQ